MGDGNAPQLFNECLWPALRAWQCDIRRRLEAGLLEVPRWGVDLALTNFADDIQQVHAAPGATAAELTEVLGASNAPLDRHFRPRGYAQNKTKQILQPLFRGRFAHKHMRDFQAAPGDGEFQIVARYLGPHLNAAGHLGRERGLRIAAARRVFYDMGRYWSSAGSARLRRSVFIAKCQAALLSGAEALLLPPRTTRPPTGCCSASCAC